MTVDSTAKLITALGALLGAVAWPTIVLALGLIFRRELKAAISRLPYLLDRVKKMKIAGFEADLDKVADASEDVPAGKITAVQVEQQQGLQRKRTIIPQIF